MVLTTFGYPYPGLIYFKCNGLSGLVYMMAGVLVTMSQPYLIILYHVTPCFCNLLLNIRGLTPLPVQSFLTMWVFNFGAGRAPILSCILDVLDGALASLISFLTESPAQIQSL